MTQMLISREMTHSATTMKSNGSVTLLLIYASCPRCQVITGMPPCNSLVDMISLLSCHMTDADDSLDDILFPTLADEIDFVG